VITPGRADLFEETTMFRRSPLAVLVLGALTTLAVLAGCGRSTFQPKTSGFGTVSVKLTDAPAAFDHIFLDVTELWVHRVNDGTSVDTSCHCEDSGTGSDALHRRQAAPQGDPDGVWFKLNATAGIYDLLDLQNGIFKTLAVGTVPSGLYDQVRLKLGAANTIVVNGVTSPLKVPSGQESGFKLFGVFGVPADGVVEIGIDIDASRSVFQTGNGTWMMKPVARIVPIETAGSIHGTVSPSSVTSWVYALMGTDTVTSTRTNTSGGFTLSLLTAGDYAVHIVPVDPAFKDTTLSPVHVVANQTTQLGTIVLGGTTPQPGRLIGVVMPDNFTTRAYLLQSGSVQDSTDTGAGGAFAFDNLTAGTYDLHLVPLTTGIRDTTLTGLAVNDGATTDVGMVALSPIPPLFADEFSGTTLSPLWQAASWQGGGSATVGGGIVSIDGYGLTSNATFGPGVSVEFVATFRNDAFQNVGLATGAGFGAPWVAVGTGSGNGVFARSNGITDVSLGAGLIGASHQYRIDWTATGFNFWVDGVLVTTVPAVVGSNMNVELSDYNPNGTALDVDWVHVVGPGGAANLRTQSAMRSTMTRSLAPTRR
jgi:hypothetical protein